MNNFDILRKSIFQLPKKRGSKYLPDFLATIFEDYLITIKDFDEMEGKSLEKHHDNISNFCDQIVLATKQYLNGLTVNAYNELAVGLELVENHLYMPIDNAFEMQDVETLFRMRNGTNRVFSKNEMFHIPFDRREIIKTQRYSIPGLPCLYLGNSIYICWEELRRPNINNVQVSRFEIDKSRFKLLDLSFLPAGFIQSYENLKKNSIQGLNLTNLFLSYIITWPLMASCSIVTSNDDGHFKPEHIIPQLLLQWVSVKHKLDGIKYMSTRIIPEEYKGFGSHVNYVLPTKKIEKEGICKHLANKTKLTESISWQLLSISNPNLVSQKTTNEELDIRVMKSMPSIMEIELTKGKPMNYFQTAFGKMEIELCKMEASSLLKPVANNGYK